MKKYYKISIVEVQHFEYLHNPTKVFIEVPLYEFRFKIVAQLHFLVLKFLAKGTNFIIKKTIVFK